MATCSLMRAGTSTGKLLMGQGKLPRAESKIPGRQAKNSLEIGRRIISPAAGAFRTRAPLERAQTKVGFSNQAQSVGLSK